MLFDKKENKIAGSYWKCTKRSAAFVGNAERTKQGKAPGWNISQLYVRGGDGVSAAQSGCGHITKGLARDALALLGAPHYAFFAKKVSRTALAASIVGCTVPLFEFSRQRYIHEPNRGLKSR